MTGILTKIQEYGELVKFEHTIFALPFALSAMLLACPPNVWPHPLTVFYVLLAMVGGRTYAMACNRLIDRNIDAKNPRTQDRALPAGKVNTNEVWLMILAAAALFIFATAMLPPICLKLLPIAFFVLTLYSYMKRISSLAHLVLGVALGSSAVGGWVAVTGELSWLPVFFGFSVMFWVAGFDVIYACQDVTFDQAEGLKSLPAALGVRQALWLSRVFHALAVGFLITVGMLYPHTGLFYWAAVLLTAGMLLYEHNLIRARSALEEINLDKVNAAFFQINGQISMMVLVLIVLDKVF